VFSSAFRRRVFLGKDHFYRGSWWNSVRPQNLLSSHRPQILRFGVFARSDQDRQQILRTFYRIDKIQVNDKKLFWVVDDGLIGLKLSHAISTKGGETIVGQGKKITSSLMKEIQKAKIAQVEVAANDLEGAYIAADVVDMSTGEVMIDANQELTTTAVGRLLEAGIDSFEIFFPERDEVGTVISSTLRKDACKTQQKRSSKFTQAASATRRRSTRPRNCSRACSSTPASTISRVGRMKFNIQTFDRATTPLEKRSSIPTISSGRSATC
jgi:DNA-directed RNA polymerase subunit beta